MIENAIELVGEVDSTGEIVGEVVMGATAGTTNYERLNNKPKINSVELIGNLTLEGLGIQPAGDYIDTESDPTVPEHVKAITEEDIAKWNEGSESGTTDYNELINKPTNVSAFTNDAGYVNEEYVNNAISAAITTVLEGEY